MTSRGQRQDFVALARSDAARVLAGRRQDDERFIRQSEGRYQTKFRAIIGCCEDSGAGSIEERQLKCAGRIKGQESDVCYGGFQPNTGEAWWKPISLGLRRSRRRPSLGIRKPRAYERFKGRASKAGGRIIAAKKRAKCCSIPIGAQL